MPIPEAAEFIRQIDDPLARDIKTEILKRMNALIEIGLSYLSLAVEQTLSPAARRSVSRSRVTSIRRLPI